MYNKAEQKEKWLEEHDRLSRLFKEDRLTFERERKRCIDKAIGRSCSRTGRIKLRELQNNWDSVLKHAGSEHNRFVLIQMLFWNHVNDIWYPALHNYEEVLRGSFSFS